MEKSFIFNLTRSKLIDGHIEHVRETMPFPKMLYRLKPKEQMDDVKAVVTALELFQEKAEKLESLSFTKDVTAEGQGLKFSFRKVTDEKYGFFSERTGPAGESIDAFVLTFRFFLQDNEKSSFRNLAAAYQCERIPQHLRDEFIRIRREVNLVLDSQPPFGLTVGEKSFTCREIMEIFIYGGLSHANEEKYAWYQRFKDSPPLFGLAEWNFVQTLSSILTAVRWVEELNSKTLRLLK